MSRTAAAVCRLGLENVDAVAALLRQAYDWALPHLAGRHTGDEDRAFVRGRLFGSNILWGAFQGDQLIGYIAVNPGWIDHLYVLPEQAGRGVGSRLLDIARERERQLDLWTFQSNTRARQFYAKRGFAEVEWTDGSGNDEKEPDVRCRWTAQHAPHCC